MPNTIEVVHSNEEHQDAECELPKAFLHATLNTRPDSAGTDHNAAIVEGIIKQQCGLQLDDDTSGDKAKSNDKCSSEENPKPISEYQLEVIDEVALKEKEDSMTPEELEANKEKANAMKLEANELVKNNEYKKAIDLYTHVLKIWPLDCSKERAVLYGNRAAAKIKTDSKKSALEDCCKAVELWPEYVRVLLRRAKLYEHEVRLAEALADYKRVYELDPGQHEASEAMIRLPPVIQERNERLKEEMLDNLKDLANLILKPFGLSSSNFQMQQDPNTGTYSINFNPSPS